MASHFERAIEKAKGEALTSMLAIANGDSHKHAETKGVHKGLCQALELFRKSARSDDTELQD